MPAIHQIRIHRFRGLRDVVLSDLARVNLLVGGNNSGKTSVLEALGVYCQPMDPLAWLKVAWSREVDRTESQVAVLSWLFPRGNGGAEKVGPIALQVSGAAGRVDVGAEFEVLERVAGPDSAHDALVHGTHRSHKVARRNVEHAKQNVEQEKRLATGEADVGSPAGVSSGQDRHASGGAEVELVWAERVNLLAAVAGLAAAVAAMQPQRLKQAKTAINETGALQRGCSLHLTCSIEQPGRDSPEEHREAHRFWDGGDLDRPSEIPGPTLPVETISPFSHRLQRLQIQQLTTATLSNFKDRVVTLIRLFDPKIEDLVILAPDGRTASLYIRHADLGAVPVTAFGDGLRRALMYALTLPTVSGGVLLVDELETAIHVSALGEVFSWLVAACRDLDVQLFATTHSLEALDALLAASAPHLEDIAGYRLDPSNQDAPVRRYSGELLDRLRHERGLDVR